MQVTQIQSYVNFEQQFGDFTLAPHQTIVQENFQFDEAQVKAIREAEAAHFLAVTSFWDHRVRTGLLSKEAALGENVAEKAKPALGETDSIKLSDTGLGAGGLKVEPIKPTSAENDEQPKT